MGIFSGGVKKRITKEGANSAGNIEKVKNTEETPEKLWEKCPSCNEIIYKKDIEKNNNICPKCGYYFNLSSWERIELLIDKDTFSEYDETLKSANPLNFPGYKERIEANIKENGVNDAVVTGVGNINGIKVSIAVMEFSFMAGSMGSVVGEKVTRTIERGIELNIPVVIVSSSGGARMHEGIFSLMQMAKTSAALDKLRDKALPFISIPVNPTTGGVTASFAMLGDIIISEPKALIAFAGPRVIEQTIKQKLPEGFQRSEFLLEHGMLDIIAKREELKQTVYRALNIMGFKKEANVSADGGEE